ncbi:MAG: CoA transferase [Rhodospirillaceae bacterium]|jgi:crotonobetainyl-CoA:carnitine CoA-transferase CaiB-like acyl-CoA transferase|nr:CoA transferase [Rhodospirillaceae bacterium]MBT5912007.1 CoA transferase [Rhodospirillaceae bacterium]MBT6307234.1 CoA transferase [Rhodospirillaceae bacterium]MBT7732327.1 CoA transferase [Rhodospirillaceae bacterium]
MDGALKGIKILDLTSVGFGPYACQILGDYGAEIIKIESPDGDITRGIAPFRNNGMGHFFLNANRNKRSLVLDLKKPEAKKIFFKLAETADVLITSIRPAAMDRLGLGFKACQKVNDKLIYVALVGFGQSGPYAKRPAYDDIIQGVSGMASMQGGRNGDPTFVNASICDKICSQVAAHATLAALYSRTNSETGQLVEVPMFESMVGFNLVEHQAGMTFNPALGSTGYERSMAEHRKPYATLDGFVCALPYTTKHWQTFFSIMKRNEMINDLRVTDPKLRSEKIGELYELVSELVKTWKTEDLLDALNTGDIPHGEATALDDLANDPHLEKVGYFQTWDHPSEGKIKLTAPPVKFSKTPATIDRLPPSLGEHNSEILKEIGFDDEEISALRRNKIIEA